LADIGLLPNDWLRGKLRA